MAVWGTPPVSNETACTCWILHDDCVISKCISCSISGLSNQRNEKQPPNSSHGPSPLQWTLFSSADPSDSCGLQLTFTYSCMSAKGSVVWAEFQVQDTNRILANELWLLLNPSDYQNLSASMSEPFGRLASCLTFLWFQWVCGLK